MTHGRGYELQMTDGEVDVQLAERLLDEHRPRDALALWRGQPLADLAEEPFAAAEIRRLEELRLRATEMAVDADLEAGRHAEVVGELDALAAEHPLRERVHGQRMLALYRCGRQSEALEAYRDARTSLVDEIGVEPGAESPAAARGHPRPGSGARPARHARRRAGGPSRPPPARARHLLIGAAVLLLLGVTAFGVIRVLEPEGLAGIDENSVGLIDPESGRITDSIPVGKSPSAGSAAEDRCGSQTRPTAPSRASTGTRQRGEDPVGGPGCARVRRGLVVGRGQRLARWSRSTRARPRSCGRITSATCHARWRSPPAPVWVASGVDGRSAASISTAAGWRSRSWLVRSERLAVGTSGVWAASEEAGR